jgi:membrane protease YdiL (CAAX protease family)
MTANVFSKEPAAREAGVFLFFVLACLITWSLSVPVILAWLRREVPSPLGIACVGLSAFGPLLAVLAVAGPRHRLREVFTRWKTPVHWPLLALVTPLAIHLLATALYAALGGHPKAWFHPPLNAEHVAALIVFPLGEEFGWRGFAHAPMARRFGAVRGALLVGSMWGSWHLFYSFTPEAAGFDWLQLALLMIELPLYALPIAWMFERANRSMAVAIAFHAGGHLDHLERGAGHDLGLHAAHIFVLAVVALFTAKALAAAPRVVQSTSYRTQPS